MKTTNVENNPGAASIIIDSKTLEVVCSTILAESDVEKNPLNIMNAQEHTCEFDEERGISRRKYDGKEQQIDFQIMKQIRDDRMAQGKEIKTLTEEELKKQGIYISEDGTILRPALDVER